jgi:hypothetical protein
VQDVTGVAELRKYLAEKLSQLGKKLEGKAGQQDPAKSASTKKAIAKINELLEASQASPAAEGSLGWLLSERLINMPPQLAPPLYRILGEELTKAVKESVR